MTVVMFRSRRKARPTEDSMPPMIDIKKIEKMSREEKLQTMEAIWADLLILSLSFSGCFTARKVNLRELEIQGKVSWLCAGASNVVGVPLDIVCVPITVPLAGYGMSQWDWGGEYGGPYVVWGMVCGPGIIVESVCYNAGAGLAYPLYLVGDVLPSRLALLVKNNDSIVTEIMDSWEYANPKVSRNEYAVLVRASGREFPPAYHRDSRPESLWYCFLSHTNRSIGNPDRILPWLKGEWSAWDRAGRPRGGRSEAAHVLGYWVVERHYWGAGESRFEKRLGSFAPSDIEYLESITGVTRETVGAYRRECALERGQKPPEKAWMWPKARRLWVEEQGGKDQILQDQYGASQ
jgi:hypothetical protein